MVDSILLEKAFKFITGEDFSTANDNRVWQTKSGKDLPKYCNGGQIGQRPAEVL